MWENHIVKAGEEIVKAGEEEATEEEEVGTGLGSVSGK